MNGPARRRPRRCERKSANESDSALHQALHPPHERGNLYQVYRRGDGAAAAWILSYLIDDIVPLRDIGLILLWGGAMVLAAVAALVTNIVANRMAAWVAQHTTQALPHDLFAKISYLSCSQIDSYSIPSLESRLTSDTYNVHQMIGMMQRMGVRAPILLVGGILITLTLDPVLTLVLVCTLPFLAVLVFCVSKRGIPLYVGLQQGVDAMVRTVRENISGIRVIKAFQRQSTSGNALPRSNGEVVRREKKRRASPWP